MKFFNWPQLFRHREFNAAKSRNKRRHKLRQWPNSAVVELLENRTLLSTFTIENCNDAGSLQEVSAITSPDVEYEAGVANRDVIGTVDVIEDEVGILSITLADAFNPDGSLILTQFLATVSSDTPVTTDVDVAIAADEPNRLRVRGNTVIPAGMTTSDEFWVSIIDDGFVSGPTTFIISASATGYRTGVDTIEVPETSVPTITIDIEAPSIRENSSSTTGTVTRNSAPATDLVVNLSSSHSGRVTIPDSVTIPAGESTSLPFAIVPVSDAIAYPGQVVTIEATASDNLPDTDTLIVFDDDAKLLTVNFAATSIDENGGITSATVSRTTDTTEALTIDLRNHDAGINAPPDVPRDVIVPEVVIIPAGRRTSDPFIVEAKDNSIDDGFRTATITAVVQGFPRAFGKVFISDDDGEEFIVTGPGGGPMSGPPLISWTNVKGAESYDLWVNVDNTGQNVFRESDISATQARRYASGVSEFGRYRVFVYANMPDGTQLEAAGHTFVVEARVSVIQIGVTASTQPDFIWNSIPGADHYEFFVNLPGTPLTAIVDDPGTGNAVRFRPSDSLPAGDFKWWFRPVRDNGYTGAWNHGSEFSTGGRTKLIAPFRNMTTTNTILNLRWSAVPDALSYEIYVSKSGTRGALYRYAGITENVFRTQPLQNGEYNVWIRTTMSTGNRAWGSSVAFTVDASSSGLKTTPLSPLLSGFETTPEFRWERTESANGYQVYLHSGTSSIQSVQQSDTSWRPSSALAEGEWTWFVRPISSGVPGEWSEPISFSTNGRTQILSPAASTADTTPTFTWNAVLGATGYSLQVDNRTTGTARVIREDGLIDATFTPDTVLTRGTYRAWVRAVNDSITAPWSFQFDFVVVAAEVSADERNESQLSSLIDASVDPLALRGVVAVAQTRASEPWDSVAHNSDGHTSEPTSSTAADFDREERDAEFAAAGDWLGSIQRK